MKKEVTEADSVNLLRNGGQAQLGLNPKLGDKPCSIRKRGFWRAYRRSELWAVMSYATSLLFSKELDKQIFGQDLLYSKLITDKYVSNNIIYLTYPIKEIK
jgi:hypothetical protein